MDNTAHSKIFATVFGGPCWSNDRMQGFATSSSASFLKLEAPPIFIHSQWFHLSPFSSLLCLNLSLSAAASVACAPEWAWPQPRARGASERLGPDRWQHPHRHPLRQPHGAAGRARRHHYRSRPLHRRSITTVTHLKPVKHVANAMCAPFRRRPERRRRRPSGGHRGREGEGGRGEGLLCTSEQYQRYVHVSAN